MSRRLFTQILLLICFAGAVFWGVTRFVDHQRSMDLERAMEPVISRSGSAPATTGASVAEAERDLKAAGEAADKAAAQLNELINPTKDPKPRQQR
jgi:hypothetical protein